MAVMNLDRIGKYRIVDRIGQGAMGEVFKAHDPLLNRYVALKTISPALAGDPEFRQRFQREAQAAAQLNHPNIVTIFDFGNDDAGLTYMAMELLEGVDLREAIRRRSLGTLLQRIDLMEQVCDGVGFAHSRGVVHRDLKPGNIHIQPSGQVKVLDFGLARLSTSDMTRSGTVLGTPHYMSPEQVRGQKADARSDVFSLGAVFYEVLTHQKAFDGHSVSEILQSIAKDAPEPIRRRAPDTPEAVAAVVERALASESQKRFVDAGELGRALVEARDSLAGETLVNPSPLEQTVLQGPGATVISHARPQTDGSTALDPRRRSSIGRRSSLTVRPDPTVAGEATEMEPPSSRLPLVAGGVLVLAAAVGGTWLWLQSRGPTPTSATSAAQERSVLSEALLSGKIELAHADLDNRAYKDAITHAKEALAIDPRSAEAKDVLDKAEGAIRDIDTAAKEARAAVARGDTATATEALGRLLTLDRHHPAAAELSRDLNRFARKQAEDARGLAAASRAAADATNATRAPAYAQANRIVAEADGLFRRELFVDAAQKYLESRDAFEAVKREADAARAAEAARQVEAARQAEAARAEAARAAEARAAAARPAPTGRPSPSTTVPTSTPPPVVAASTPLPTAMPTAAATAAAPAASSAGVPAAPVRESQDAAVRRAIADYGRALETQDLDLFRTVKPDLSADQEKQLRESFKSVRYDRVGFEFDSVEVKGSEAVVKVTSQYTLNGREQKPQKLQIHLTRAGSSWKIVSMGPQ
jgi:serine/threonine protein kinase